MKPTIKWTAEAATLATDSFDSGPHGPRYKFLKALTFGGFSGVKL